MKTINLFSIALVVLVTISGCKKNELHEDALSNSVDLLSYSQDNIKKEYNLIEFPKSTKDKYDISDIWSDDMEGYKIVYNNGKTLFVSPYNASETVNTFLLEGTAVGKTSVLMKMYGYGESDFLGEVEISYLSSREMGVNKSKRPGETYNACFAREWREFCEDFVSCMVQITNPIPVAAAVAVSCAF